MAFWSYWIALKVSGVILAHLLAQLVDDGIGSHGIRIRRSGAFRSCRCRAAITDLFGRPACNASYTSILSALKSHRVVRYHMSQALSLLIWLLLHSINLNILSVLVDDLDSMGVKVQWRSLVLAVRAPAPRLRSLAFFLSEIVRWRMVLRVLHNTCVTFWYMAVL